VSVKPTTPRIAEFSRCPISPSATAQNSKLPWNHCIPKGTLGIEVTVVQKLESMPGAAVGFLGDRADHHLPEGHDDPRGDAADRPGPQQCTADAARVRRARPVGGGPT